MSKVGVEFPLVDNSNSPWKKNERGLLFVDMDGHQPRGSADCQTDMTESIAWLPGTVYSTKSLRWVCLLARECEDRIVIKD